MSTHIKPCPFCGKDPKTIERATSISESGNYCFFIACYGDGYSAHAHHGGYASSIEGAREIAVASWNRRSALSKAGEA